MVQIPPLDHVAVLTDDVGMIQHADETVPNRSTGYCTDDISRAFMVVLARLRLTPRDEQAMAFASTYLAYLGNAQMEDGRFHNFMSYEHAWLDDVGTEDSYGRAMWSLGYGIRYAPTEPWRRVCRKLFDRGLESIESFTFLRPRAYTMLGLAYAFPALHDARYKAMFRRLGDALTNAYDATRGVDWPWFEESMTYDNARLPEALIRAGHALGDERYADVGLVTLAFYERVTMGNGIFIPIGNHGWYTRGGERAIYSQQPLEAASLIDAELAAYDATGDETRMANAQAGLAWFYGKNTRGETMAHGGGCYDGLDESTVNHNMGAESTLALLAGAYALAERQKPVLRAVR